MSFKRNLVYLSVAGALAALSGNAAAAAFALIEQSSGLGNAFAGGAAAAEDATTLFFNPAGMSRLSGRQASVAGTLIQPSARFTDTGSTAAPLQNAGGNGGDAGSLVLVPNTYMVSELDAGWRFGLGIFVPFGLKTEYDPGWIGRFQAIKSGIQTVNLNPALSWRVSDGVSLGVGVNYQRIWGELTSAVNYSALAGGALGPNLEGVSTIKGSDSAWGYNLGVLFDVSPATRVGVAYRSGIDYTLKGTISFSDVPAPMAASPLLANGDAVLPISMPDSLSISAFHRLDDEWDVMADATRTGWSVLQQMKIDRTDGSNVMTVQENWKDSWRYAVGATRHHGEQWLVRVGAAYDQTPVPDAYRTARIPDSSRTWLTLGGQYKPSPASTVDFGYAHLFMKDATIADDQTATGRGNLVGTYKNGVNIVSVQYGRSF